MPRSPGGSSRSGAQEGGQVDAIALKIKQALAEAGIKAEVWGREKHPFSIWKKMAERHVSFEQITDIMAFRVLTESVEDCYRAIGVLHQAWQFVPGRFKDYISTPKTNGYRSAAHRADLRELDARRSADPHPARCTGSTSSASPRTGPTSRATGPTARSAGCAT